MMAERNIRGFALLVALLIAAGCGGGEGDGGGSGGGEAVVENPVDPATAGSISGTVTFTGTAPAGEPIDMSDEDVCLAKHSSPPMTQPVVVGADGGLANVFVYVKSGLEGLQFPTPSDPVVLDQAGCVYSPHVMGIMAGQDLNILNSDSVLHNVRLSPTDNRGFNRSQPFAGMTLETTFAVAEVMVPVVCDVHGWMEAYIGVTEHPYHTVSGGNGAFSLSQLPPGDYELEAWHETYGTITQTVTVPASGMVEVSFEFNDQMAGLPVPMGPPLLFDHATGEATRRTVVADQ